MIYLNKIKVAVFDFDGTLAIHKDKIADASAHLKQVENLMRAKVFVESV